MRGERGCIVRGVSRKVHCEEEEEGVHDFVKGRSNSV